MPTTRLTFAELRELIRAQLLGEATQYYEEVTLSDGSPGKYGDESHVTDMEGLVAGMECLRNQQRRGTAARSIYANAVRQLKSQIKGARSKGGGAVTPEVEAVDPSSIERPGKPRRPKPGFDGGRATVPGHGRYEPGTDDR